jgi:hypothetical protein
LPPEPDVVTAVVAPLVVVPEAALVLDVDLPPVPVAAVVVVLVPQPATIDVVMKASANDVEVCKVGARHHE